MSRREKMRGKFDRQQVKSFVKDAVARVGGQRAWEFVGYEIRSTAIEAKAFNVFRMQVEEARFGSQDLGDLFVDMMTVAGMYENGKGKQ